MNNDSFTLARLVRAGLSLLLALMVSSAAGAGLAAPPAAPGDTATIDDLFARLAGAGAGQRLDLKPITLVQLEDQLRRPEMQASIGKGSIAVLYPNVAEPFRSAFVSMIQGIEERTRLRVRSYAVDAKMDAAELNAQLKRNGAKVVIALGRRRY
jgi:putative ABC transport system substrate-binding protein